MLLAASLSLLALIVGAAMWLGPNDARGDEGGAVPDYLPAGQEGPPGLVPTAAQTKGALESPGIGKLGETAETDPQVARELPHRDLGREEALELAEGVFGTELEGQAGILDELQGRKFLSDNAVVLPVSALPEAPAPETGEGAPEPSPTEDVLVESSVPLRSKNDEGEEEAVDLTLQPQEGAGGELAPVNPLAEVEIPGQLGEGVTLPGPEVGIAVVGAPAETTPSDVEGQYAFYPDVAEDTDLIVAPTPAGVDVMTDIRSAEAPLSTTYELSLPAGASLQAGPDGSAEVIEGGKSAALITPPSATDAAGNAVESSMKVEGDNLVVSVSPEVSTEYPILVDPEYLPDNWNWTWWQETFHGWSGSTTGPAYQPEQYAFWEGPSGSTGLDLVSGGWAGAESGTHADWLYTVPRYNEDIAKFGAGSPPTTWISSLWAENIYFVENGFQSINYPALVLGLADPTSPSFWSSTVVHYGGQGELQGTSASLSNMTGESNGQAQGDTGTKAVDMDLVTYEAEPQAKSRNAHIGAASVALIDNSTPQIRSLTPPTGWVTGASATVGYSFEDTGLGVRSAQVRLRGETTYQAGAGADFGCNGTTASPCPRVASSTEAGRPALTFVPSDMPTGEDTLEVTIGNPFWNTTHINSAAVPVKVDNTAPVVTLSGALTEQEKVGTTKSEYPLTIGAVDGTEADPQSGISSVEVKVDGKKITMPNETLWHPGCKTRDCPFSGSWTLKASEYTTGSHEVEVVATDAIGNASTTTLEVEVGQGAPQTTFTTPHPTYENHEIRTVGFKATREGKPVEGATFRCSFDGASATPCASPYEPPERLEAEKWHVLTVAAVDKAGKVDPTPARWTFKTGDYPKAPGYEKLVYPEVGDKTAAYYTLEAEWAGLPEGKAAEGVTGVSFEMELPGWGAFKPVPEGCTIDGQGRPVSWPLPAQAHPGHSKPVYLKVHGCPAFEEAGYPEKEIQFRPVFDGGEKVAGAGEPVATEFVYRYNANRVPTDATEAVGPATVDLLTGAFTLSRTDVSIPVPGYESNLEFTRVYSSTIDKSQPGYSKVMGGAWQPSSPLESEFEGEAWTRIQERHIPAQPAEYGEECWNEETEEWEEGNCGGPCPSENCEKWLEVPAEPEENWIELLDNEGTGVVFEIVGSGPGRSYVSPEYAKELKLTTQEGNFVLGYPNGTDTTFVVNGVHPEGEREYVPEFISYQSGSNSMRLVYKTIGSHRRLEREIAPAPVACPEWESQKVVGCRTLVLEYASVGGEEELGAIKYYGPSGNAVGNRVAEYSYITVPGPAGNEEELWSERDPRLPNLVEWYAYDSAAGYGNLLTGVDPPGQATWSFAYELGNSSRPSRLEAVERGSTKTTLAYGVPITGSAAPYDMSAESIARWGQADLPVDATAVFPPNHQPAEYPPHSFTGATMHYMDPEGHEVNTATPSPPGVSGATISTSETDVHGNTVREPTPRARLIALESANPAARSHELDSHSVYNAAGTEMLESWGPLHPVRLESSGESVEAREHTIVRYDEEEPTPPVGIPPAYLPTKETVAAVVPSRAGEFEPRVTVTKYEWVHRLPEETIVDPGGLAIHSVTRYNPAGQVEETKQPKGVAAGQELTAGDTRTIYYSATGTGECMGSPRYANLPCKVLPAKQESAAGTRPELLVKKFLGYDELDEPTEVLESPGGGTGAIRKTIATYDSAGRQVTSKVEGGGTGMPKTETVYSPTLGQPTEQKLICPEKSCTGFDNQATKVEYNSLGQVTEYEDADGAKTKTTYDAFGRPATVTDPRGTETMHYDEASGVLTSEEVSGVGTFTAAYDADGDLIRRGLPNGLTANTTYNVADEPTKLTYTKESSCGSTGCTWYEESLERSAGGQILSNSDTNNGELVKNLYKYDKAGRLEEAQETPPSGLCVSRHYTFDADSNRLTKTTRPSAIKGAVCPSSGGNTQGYTYDNADRLIGPTYDAFGRIEILPAEFAGGKALTTTYFANDMVATQSQQGGVTNTFQLDATGRQRQREQTGGVAGVEVFHYDGPGDSPSWTALGSTWSRNITGIGGELAAVQESSGTTTFKLTDLHGNVVASASSSPSVTALLSTSRFSEFGEPESGSPGRFGWLGGKSRRTELQSGVIQMGARSYIPQLGRFLTPDPIPGGSANAYDYANQDPVNSSDPTGLKPYGRNHGFIHAGIHIWSPKGRKGGTHGTMKVRLFTRMECHTCGPTKGLGGEVHVASAEVTMERGVGSGNVVESRPIKSPTLEGEMPWGWENWNKGSPIEFACEIGQEYKVTLTVVIGVTFGRIEPESVSAEEVCGHGRY